MATHNIFMFSKFEDSLWAGDNIPTAAEAAASLIKVQNALDASAGPDPVVSASNLRIKMGFDPAAKLALPVLFVFDAVVDGTLLDEISGGADGLEDLIEKDVIDCTFEGMMSREIIIDD